MPVLYWPTSQCRWPIGQRRVSHQGTTAEGMFWSSFSYYALQNLSKVLGEEMLRLCVRRIELVDFNEAMFRQTAGNVFASRPARLVLVQHHDDVRIRAGVLADEFLLRGGHSCTHEGDRLFMSSLMDFHAIKEPLDNE